MSSWFEVGWLFWGGHKKVSRYPLNCTKVLCIRRYRVIFKNIFMLFVAIHEQILQPIEIHPIEMTGGCAEIATGCCYFGQRSMERTQLVWAVAAVASLVSLCAVSTDTGLVGASRVAGPDCTDRCLKQQQPVAISAQPPVISIGWFHSQICLCFRSFRKYGSL